MPSTAAEGTRASMQDGTTDRPNDGRKKRAAGAEALRAPPAPAPPRGAGRGNPTSVPGRICRDRLESRHVELDLRHHIRRGVLFVTLENDRLGALGRFGVEVEKFLMLRCELAEHGLAPDAPGFGLRCAGP